MQSLVFKLAVATILCSSATLYTPISYARSQLIDTAMIELLAKHPAITDVKIAPDGRHLAIRVFVEGHQSLAFYDAASMKMVGSFRMQKPMQVGEFHWVNNERVVFKLTETLAWQREPVYYGELYGVNYDGSKGELLFGFRAGKKQTGTRLKQREGKSAWADFVFNQANETDRILLKATPSSEGGDRLPDLVAMDVYNGELKSKGRAPIAYADVVADQQGEPRIASGIDNKYDRQVYLKDIKTDQWQQLPARNYGHYFSPIAVTADNQGLHVLDNFEQDIAGIFEYRFADGSYKPVFTDDTVSITNTLLTADTQSVYAVRLDDGKPSFVFLSDQLQEATVFSNLLETFPGDDVAITSKSRDGKKWVVKVSSDKAAAIFYLYDHEKVTLAKIADSRPELAGKKFATTEPVKFKSFDGLDIHGYWTQSPVQSEHKPTIVLVHGGPHGVRDYWGFDTELQFLALSGYNVLQVNFRGSGGYGYKFQQLGHRQWGDAIQRDIIAGTEWAIAQGKAKAGNLCIMGGSFGAYSTVQSATLAPDLFKCGVAVAGVYDLSLLAGKGDIQYLSYGKAYLDEAVGTDEAQLQQYSPIHHVSKLKAHLLIAHGKKDERAPYIHAERLQQALDKAGKPYQWLEFNDETHGFYDPVNRTKYFNELKVYFSKHLVL
ncbi:hypothetical protein A5320_08800 [Rheinheimera sp. SA_1]|uniref:alpha/beta hydrolase family protein n=1 Tax=Rheinheimera sp. SA_1 TaxID=1827365 RepID=UPI0007FFB01E|nr:S9 family peptidase [Rheinheimera sp. SA_1]OBP15445.1 hypothetical protein A5320_08800 [Rheinheimera sp. SA_1]